MINLNILIETVKIFQNFNRKYRKSFRINKKKFKISMLKFLETKTDNQN